MRKQVFGLVFMGLVLAACAGTTPEAKEAPGGVNLEPVTLDRGAEPRGPLRYMAKQDQNQKLLLRLSLGSFVETQLAYAEAELPIVDLIAAVGPSFRTEQPNIFGYPIRFEFVRIEGGEGLDEQTRGEVMAEMAHLTETSAVFEIDDRGITRKATVSISKKASPRMMTLLGNIRTTLLSAALPVEDVGIGARWQVDRVLEVGGMKVPQQVTYSLLGRDSEHLRIGVTVRQSAPPQQFALGAEGGDKLIVEAYEVSAVGVTLVDLREFAPLGELHGLSQIRGTYTTATASTPFLVNSDLMVQLAPLPAEAAVPAPAAATPAPAAAPVAVH